MRRAGVPLISRGDMMPGPPNREIHQATLGNTWPSGVKVQNPPSLDIERYSAWKREFTFRREIYQFLPDSYLLSIVGAGPSLILKNMVMKLFCDTRMDPSERTISGLIGLLGKNYALSEREKERWHPWGDYL